MGVKGRVTRIRKDNENVKFTVICRKTFGTGTGRAEYSVSILPAMHGRMYKMES